MADSKLRLVLMGTGPFAVPSFDRIADGPHEIVQVIVRPLPPVKSRGGPPPQPVADWAEKRSLTVIRPDSINDDETVQQLRSLRPDLLVVCDYGQILKPAALETAPLGGINLHGSLLPKYRGAAPVQRAVLSGDRKTGVTVIHMTPRLDGGPILARRVTEIRDDETAGQLEQRLSAIGVDATVEAIDRLLDWDQESVIGDPQDSSLVSKAPRLSKAEAQIDWQQSSRMIDCHVRGMQPWPVAFSFFHPGNGGKPVRVQIRQVTPIDDNASGDAPGQSQPGHLVSGEGLCVASGDGVLRIDQIQPAGKKPMTGAAFANGYQPGPDACFAATCGDAAVGGKGGTT
ncbi:methionyl-tRNA formyltransferase [Crateriforma spongiae]|uniref:methionyl-tRNA formyltransferase n=1 Tax=Crateriforma spongiae TaxID=2724528 RepID=UPI0039AF6FCC